MQIEFQCGITVLEKNIILAVIFVTFQICCTYDILEEFKFWS